MDRDQQELKSIRFWGILKKTFKIIYKERMIFAKITLSFILPLTIILLGYPQFNVYVTQIKMSDGNEVEYEIVNVLLALAGIMLALIFFLLPTSAIVYTIASIHTAKKFTFKKIFLSVVPKAWIRLMVTFAIQFLIVLAYNFVTILVLIPQILWLTDRWLTYGLIIFAVLYLIGSVYISLIWNLANVVSLLEDLKGYRAIKKSKALLKGRRLVASSLFVLVALPVVVIQILYSLILSTSLGYNVVPLEYYTYIIDEYEYDTERADKVRYGVILLTMVLVLHVCILFGLVIQTLFYFVCKSYHHEIIDKSYLADHLENFLSAAAYAPPVEKNVQLEHSDV